MSKTVDERVVSMQFDNKQFEQNVRTSMSTLEKLKQSLNLSGAAKGLESVNAAAKNCDMSGLSTGLEAARTKFSALQVMGVTALATITHSAINAGTRIVKALTIDPVKMGFQEYETQINAVQTILANTSSKGTTLNQVNAALDELNHYADLTIYNFTEMTRNIGTFTAAGVDLDTSVQAIKGIANLAAVSGSNSQQASTAMYQLSQALAAGTVKLMDWNSVVNAGMGGQVFQDALKETARVHGIAIDDMIKSEGSFRETLQEGWLTSDILTETLNKFTGDMSESQLKQLGYTKEQISEIMELGKMANDAATKVKTFTQLFDTLKEAAQSGWTQSWEIIVGDFEEAKALLTEMSDVIGGIIGASAEARNKVLSEGLSSGWDQFLGKGIADESGYIEEIKSVAKEHGISVDSMIKKEGSFEATLKSGWLTSDIMAESLSKLTDKTKGLSDKQLEELGYTREQVNQLEELNESIQNGSVSVEEFAEKITKASGRENLIHALRNSFEALVSIVKPIKEAFREIFPPYTGEQLYKLTEKIRDLTENFKISDTTANNLKRTFKGVFAVIDIVVEAFKAVGGGAVSLIGSLTGISGGILAVTGAFGDWISKIRDSITEADIFGTVINAIITVLKTVITKIKDFGLFAGDIFSSIGTDLSEIFSNIDFSKGLSVINSGLFAGILLAIRQFIKGLSDPFEGVSGLFNNVKGILDDVRKCFQAYQEQLKAGTLLKIATAIGLLAAAIFLISTIDAASLAKSLGAITVLFAELMGSLLIFTKIGTNITGVLKASTIMITMSVAITILAGALKIISSIDTAGVAKGVIAIGILMAELSVFLHTANFGSITRTSVGLLALSTAMVILASAVRSFGSMRLTEIGKGLLAMSGALAAIGIALAAMPKGTFTFGVGLLVISASLKVLSGALSDFGGMSWSEIGKGLAIMGGALAELAIGLKLMSGSLAGSAALLIAAGALAIITPVLKTLGSMTWTEIVKGLTTLAGAFAVIGVAGLVLSPLIPAILGLAGAFALFGVAILGIGAGLTLAGVGLAAIATGFTALAAAGTAGATAIVAALSIIITGIADLIPTVLEKLGEGIVAFCSVIGDHAPEIAKSVLILITEVLAAAATYAPQIVDSLMTFLIGILDSIANRLPELINAAVNVVMAFFQGIADALSGIDTTGLLKGIVGVGLLSALMLALSAVAGLIPGAMIGVLGIGVVIAELALVLAAIGALAQMPGLEWLISEGGQFLQTVGTAIGQFIGGIVGGIAQGFTNSMPQIGTDLSAFMKNLQPFIEGAKSIDATMLGGVKALAETILILTAADILNGIASWITGGSSMSDFAAQLVPFGNGLKAYAASVAGIDANAVATSAIAAKALVQLANNLPNSGGLVSLFTGDNDISTFGTKLVPFGRSMKQYSDAVLGISPEAVSNSVTAAKSLVKMINGMSGLDTSGVNSFRRALTSLAKSGINSFARTFSSSSSKLTSAGRDMVNAIIRGVKSGQSSLTAVASTMIGAFGKGISTKKNSVIKSATKIVTDMVADIRDYYDRFYSAGSYLVSGFAAGISSNTYRAFARARAMAAAAANAAENELDERSPSKVGYRIGDYFGIGFVNALGDNVSKSYKAGSEIAKSAKEGLGNAISKVADIINGDIDVQPTIRPVLDLSDVKSGAGAIGNMIGLSPSVGVLSNIGSISSIMNKGNQNGESAEIVSAINKLRKDLGNINGNSYMINGVTYDDGSNIADAVQTLIRAAKIERRV